VEEKALRADIEYLLSQIYLRYAIAPINQEISDHISRRVTVVILVGVAIIVLAVLLNVTGIVRETRPATFSSVCWSNGRPFKYAATISKRIARS
jgi:hypothetical protein